MGQSEGEIIRAEIQKALSDLGYSPCQKNVEMIYGYHLNDSSDMPYSNLINLHYWELEAKTDHDKACDLYRKHVSSAETDEERWKRIQKFRSGGYS